VLGRAHKNPHLACEYGDSRERRNAVTSPEKSRHIEVKAGDQTVAAAEVMPLEHKEGTVRTSLHPPSGHIPPGSRASLVDAVLDLPEVQSSRRLEATVPLGDSESLERLRERTAEAVTRPAGSTALVDADLPPGGKLPDRASPARMPGTGPVNHRPFWKRMILVFIRAYPPGPPGTGRDPSARTPRPLGAH
jgi:hypothetical protein